MVMNNCHEQKWAGDNTNNVTCMSENLCGIFFVSRVGNIQKSRPFSWKDTYKSAFLMTEITPISFK